MTFDLFGLLKPNTTIEPSKEYLPAKLKDPNSYHIECKWGGFYWNIYLWRVDPTGNCVIIKSHSASNETQLNNYIEDLKLNKDKYIRVYNEKSDKNRIIKL